MSLRKERESLGNSNVKSEHSNNQYKRHAEPNLVNRSLLSTSKSELLLNSSVKNLLVDTKTILQQVFPDTAFFDLSLETAGITNKLVKCILYPQKTDTRVDSASTCCGEFVEDDVAAMTVLVRVYGQNSELLINREEEIQNFHILGKYGYASRIYARFNNGLVYGYIPGVVFTTHDMADPGMAPLVARHLAQWHNIDNTDTAANDSSMLFPTIDKWLCAIPATFSSGETIDDAATAETTSDFLDKLAIEYDFLLKHMNTPEASSTTAFCHCDLLSGNIIYNPQLHSVSFIDYEYAMQAHPAFDIANHFCEFAGFECDYTRWPDESFQREWLRVYLSHRRASHLPPLKGSSSEIETWMEHIARYSLCAHFYWCVWALVQAEHSEIEFDFIAYAKLRFEEYLRRKSIVFAI